jgi:hypothetical protein
MTQADIDAMVALLSRVLAADDQVESVATGPRSNEIRVLMKDKTFRVVSIAVRENI